MINCCSSSMALIAGAGKLLFVALDKNQGALRLFNRRALSFPIISYFFELTSISYSY